MLITKRWLSRISLIDVEHGMRTRRGSSGSDEGGKRGGQGGAGGQRGGVQWFLKGWVLLEPN